MDCTSTRFPYRETGSFTRIALDYIDQVPALKPFFGHPPSVQGIEKAIDARKKFPINRVLLVTELKSQYSQIDRNSRVEQNLEALLSSNTFTVTTAHQNNIFTGPLYFIYKILHTIKLSEHLNQSLPAYRFVPVFYMGSEDADFEELNHVNVDDQKWVWKTKQTGAVGRMKVDKGLTELLDGIEGQISVLPYGNEVIALLRLHYKVGVSIQTATLGFVNALFGQFGLVVVLPDNGNLKKTVTHIFEDDLLNQAASDIVAKTASDLENAGYKVQANPREINLFYLEEGKRERIVEQNGKYFILHTGLSFNKDELLEELRKHPERFSPNVILRGLYQESILPNIIFIGGGGETAYWLQLKSLFEYYKVPFPVLVLRNSFMFIDKKWQDKIRKLGFNIEDFFKSEQDLLNRFVARQSINEIKLNGSLYELEQLYEAFKKQATAVDSTLEKHVDALKVRTVQRLQELEKKMLRAEKRKFADQHRQIKAIKGHLFPGNGLQERHDNFSSYYARWGKDWLQKMYDNSLSLEQEFVIIEEK